MLLGLALLEPVLLRPFYLLKLLSAAKLRWFGQPPASLEQPVYKVEFFSIDFFFTVDIFLSFFTCIPETENTDEISDKKEIAANYIKTWFTIDLLSVLPFHVLFESYE